MSEQWGDDFAQADATVIEAIQAAEAEAPAPETPAEGEAEVPADAQPADTGEKPAEAPPAETEPPLAAEADGEAESSDEQPKRPYRDWLKVKAEAKENREARDNLKRDREELESLRTQIAQERAQYESFQRGLKEDPVAALRQHGLTIEDLATRVLNDGKPSEGESSRQELAQIRAEQQKIKEQAEAASRQLSEYQQQQFVAQYRSDVEKTLAAEDFALLRGRDDAIDQVMQLAGQHAASVGELLTPSDAARLIQEELTNDLVSQAKNNEAARRLLLDALGVESGEKQAAGTPAPKKPALDGPKTLTNAMATTPPASELEEDVFNEYDLIRKVAKGIPDDAWDGL